MAPNPPSERSTTRRIRWLLVIGLIVVIAAIAATLGHRARDSSSSSPSSTPSSPAPPSPSTRASKAPRSESHGALSKADGLVPAGVTVFDDDVPAVANLRPALLKALRRAATDAADDGVTFSVNSGWRSPGYQDRLLRQAVARYGSEDAAARWVATPATSLHVSGDAVDLGHSDATTWLSRHGAEYGLCQIYRNEPWHYELRAGAVDRGCPDMYADPTQDPRMKQ